MAEHTAPAPIWPKALTKVIQERNDARAAIERIRSIHTPTPKLSAEHEARRRLNGWKEDAPQYCMGCSDPHGDSAEWPCPTIRALATE